MVPQKGGINEAVDTGRGGPYLGSDLGFVPGREQWSGQQKMAVAIKPLMLPGGLSEAQTR